MNNFVRLSLATVFASVVMSAGDCAYGMYWVDYSLLDYGAVYSYQGFTQFTNAFADRINNKNFDNIDDLFSYVRENLFVFSQDNQFIKNATSTITRSIMRKKLEDIIVAAISSKFLYEHDIAWLYAKDIIVNFERFVDEIVSPEDFLGYEIYGIEECVLDQETYELDVSLLGDVIVACPYDSCNAFIFIEDKDSLHEDIRTYSCLMCFQPVCRLCDDKSDGNHYCSDPLAEELAANPMFFYCYDCKEPRSLRVHDGEFHCAGIDANETDFNDILVLHDSFSHFKGLSYDEIKNELNILPLTKTSSECLVCFDDDDAVKFTNTCGTVVCIPCLQDFVITAYGNNGDFGYNDDNEFKTKCTCPNDNCTIKKKKFIAWLLGKNEHGKDRIEILENRILFAASGMKQCPYAHSESACQGAILLEDKHFLPDNVSFYSCAECQGLICKECDEQYLTDFEGRSMHRCGQDPNEFFLDPSEGIALIPCANPDCSQQLEKNGGCNEMKCGQNGDHGRDTGHGCGAKFCAQCGLWVPRGGQLIGGRAIPFKPHTREHANHSHYGGFYNCGEGSNGRWY